MREIKFRGKRIGNGEWVYGGYLHQYFSVNNQKLIDAIVFTDGNKTFRPQVDPETVGQYTGLKAKNDKDVYESDMLLDKFGDIYVIRWSDHWGGFCLAKPNGKYTGGKVYYSSHNPIYCGLGDYDIIGNLHDNLNLLGSSS